MGQSILRHLIHSLVCFIFLIVTGCDSVEKVELQNIPVNQNNSTNPSPISTDNVNNVSDYDHSVDVNRLNIAVPTPIKLMGSLPYPTRDINNIKSIHTDHWANRSDLIQANTGGVAVNIVWDQWESEKNTGFCNTQTGISFDGHCFTINKIVENEIKYYSSKGMIITAVLWGVPEWASDPEACKPIIATSRKFCSTSDETNFSRFVGMIANRFNGMQNVGRISDFIIHNEVNMNGWYIANCGQNGNTCDVDSWIKSYSREFNAAYDAIKQQQPAAKVFIPFAHQFDEKLRNLSSDRPVISVKTFLKGFSNLVGDRKWRVAYHPYPKWLSRPGFTPEDLPYVTYGNIGVLAGWLRGQFPNLPEAWEIHLTESGINSLNNYSSEVEQATAICDSFRNILGTPGIENYVYHRMQDHQLEVNNGAGFGLHNADGSAKLSWSLWSTMSGRKGQSNNLDCGFENDDYTVLVQYTHVNRKPWASTRIPPSGYSALASWRLHRNYQEKTVIIYECAKDDGSYATSKIGCEGGLNLGPLGYLNAEGEAPMVPLFSCDSNGVRFLSNHSSCEGSTTLEFLGYALPRT